MRDKAHKSLRIVQFLILPTVFLAASCSKSGDYDAFIRSEATRINGRLNTGVQLPAVEAKWKVQRDENGFSATVTGASFAELNQVMTNAFGPPAHISTSEEAGFQFHLWKASDIGIAIQFRGTSKGVEIVGIRGFSGLGAMIKEAAQKTEIKRKDAEN